MINILLLDLDDTILDFGKAEKRALSQMLRSLGTEPDDGICYRYSQINLRYWQMLERGEISRDQVLTGRFQALFQEMGLSILPQAAARQYESNLALEHDFLPGAREAVERLAKKYRLFAVSNGTAPVQHRRLHDSGLDRLFENVFISQEIGANKPSKAFFDRCFQQIPGFIREKTLMVGDSLTSDILGGIWCGLTTCWVNPSGQAGRLDIVPDYEVSSICQLDNLLEKLNCKKA